MKKRIFARKTWGVIPAALVSCVVWSLLSAQDPAWQYQRNREEQAEYVFGENSNIGMQMPNFQSMLQEEVPAQTAARSTLYYLGWQQGFPAFNREIFQVRYALSKAANNSEAQWSYRLHQYIIAAFRMAALFEMLEEYNWDMGAPLTLLGVASTTPISRCSTFTGSMALAPFVVAPGGVVSFFVVMLPNRPLREVIVTPSNLLPQGGASQMFIEASQVSLYFADYQLDSLGETPRWGYHLSRVEPIALQSSFQPVLVTVRVPEDAPLGTYTGSIRFAVPSWEQSEQYYYQLQVE